MRSILAAALALVLVGSASAMTLDGLKMGPTVSGPSNSLKDLKGKVVYVEIWGTR